MAGFRLAARAGNWRCFCRPFCQLSRAYTSALTKFLQIRSVVITESGPVITKSGGTLKANIGAMARPPFRAPQIDRIRVWSAKNALS
ncbi:hypothetical protein CUV01_17695 [Paracoccus tegillarcae]|uniref:Uncharacterized protein n=1 Tax=Paracoccus tegillarcae TaxID=1529068 RepID=A0A2K9EVN5_9RHOB|nr:hypothetical protein CUV01_17695 [Paracoccus tegillarcae]